MKLAPPNKKLTWGMNAIVLALVFALGSVVLAMAFFIEGHIFFGLFYTLLTFFFVEYIRYARDWLRNVVETERFNR